MNTSSICCQTDKLDRMGEKYINGLCMLFIMNIKYKINFDLYIQFFNIRGEIERELKMENANNKMNVKQFKKLLRDTYQQIQMEKNI